MTDISAKVIAHSVGHYPDQEIATVLCRYPRWIHAEMRTHRLMSTGEEWPTPSVMEEPNLSRNASSSRAIPVKRLIEDVRKNPAVPIFWGANQRGMQAGDDCDNLVDGLTRENAWLQAMERALEMAEAFDRAGYHKQIVNRLIEPFSHITVLITATDFANFYALRDHPDAEPHIQMLARQIKAALEYSHPVRLEHGEWHLPFVSKEERASSGVPTETWMKVSAARCARTSYLTHGNLVPSLEEDLALFNRLISNGTVHASPLEHQATPDKRDYLGWQTPLRHGNLHGWVQHRKLVYNERALQYGTGCKVNPHKRQYTDAGTGLAAESEAEAEARNAG